MTKKSPNAAQPRVIMTAADHEGLSVLVNAASNTMPAIASELAEELERAHVLAKGRQPVDVVCMGCEVEFRDDMTGRMQTVILVYPSEADIAQGKISVLTPIGTALIGLPVGKSINWTTRTGELKRLTVIQVREHALAERRSV